MNERKIKNEKEQPQPFFPIFVNLSGRRATIVGGGATAFNRAKTLMKFGADVRFIAPDISPETEGLVREGKAAWLQIEFAPPLLEGSDIVIAATNRRDVNHAVGEAAKKIQALVNVADSREESTYLFPGILQSDAFVAGFVTTSHDNATIKKIALKICEKLLRGKIT